MNRLRTNLFWGATLLSPLPFLCLYLSDLLRISHYQFIPVLIIVILLLIYQRWDKVSRLKVDHITRWGLAAGFGLTLIGGLLVSPFVVALGFVTLVGNWLRNHHDVESGKSLLPIWPLAFLMLRLPLSLDNRFLYFLQKKSATLSSFALDLLGVIHNRRGNIFELPRQTLFVEEACSGVQSFFALLFSSILIAVWFRRSSVLLPLYAAWAAVAALAMNTIRIVIIALGSDWYGVDLSSGTLHEILGYFCLACGILVVASGDRIFRVAAFPITETKKSLSYNPIERAWNYLLKESPPIANAMTDSVLHTFKWGMISVVSLSLCVLGVQLFGYLRNARAPDFKASLSTDLIFDSTDDFVREIAGEYSVVDYQKDRRSTVGDEKYGLNADIWKLNVKGVDATLAICQSYGEWHDLNICYEADGWVQLENEVSQDPNSWPFVSSRWKDNKGHSGFLLFSGIDSMGEVLDPPHTSIVGLLASRFSKRNATLGQANCLMIQTWVESVHPLNSKQLSEVVNLHLDIRQKVRSRMRKS